MVLTIAICIFGAAVLFAWLSRPFSDLIPVAAPAAGVPAQVATEPAVAEGPEPTEPAQSVIQTQVVPTAAPANATSAATETPFTPTHQIGASQSVNFRAGPSTGDAIVKALPPATPLEYLGEDAPTANPTDGDRWMKFRTADGDEGWVREIDTEEYQQ